MKTIDLVEANVPSLVVTELTDADLARFREYIPSLAKKARLKSWKYVFISVSGEPSDFAGSINLDANPRRKSFSKGEVCGIPFHMIEHRHYSNRAHPDDNQVRTFYAICHTPKDEVTSTYMAVKRANGLRQGMVGYVNMGTSKEQGQEEYPRLLFVIVPVTLAVAHPHD